MCLHEAKMGLLEAQKVLPEPQRGPPEPTWANLRLKLEAKMGQLKLDRGHIVSNIGAFQPKAVLFELN